MIGIPKILAAISLVCASASAFQPHPRGRGSSQLHNEPEPGYANKWSKFTPDLDLPTDEFRSQLMENMKADLEERRRLSPNRGNQPAKSYLDSLSNQQN